MMNTYDWWVAKLRAIRHSKPPEPPMRVRLHEAGHAVAGRLDRYGFYTGEEIQRILDESMKGLDR